ncbi:MAG: hypothetical protein MZV63_08465 [Marinilabiliales bacterium]|nr:hypothetical protein [Marinilabiliales bacterium]
MYGPAAEWLQALCILKFVNPAYIQLVWGVLIIFIVICPGARTEPAYPVGKGSAMTMGGLFGGAAGRCHRHNGSAGGRYSFITSRHPKEKFNAIISIFILFAVSYALVFYLISGTYPQ